MRGIDHEFLARVGRFPVRIEIPYDRIEPLRLHRIELGLDLAYRILDAWGRRQRLRDVLPREEFERRLFAMLRLYAEETQALSHSVRLPAFLAPVRERVARRLLLEMSDSGRSLSREIAKGMHQKKKRIRNSTRE